MKYQKNDRVGFLPEDAFYQELLLRSERILMWLKKNSQKMFMRM